jgi:hypothetical protein
MSHILSFGPQTVIAFSGATDSKQPVACAIDLNRDLSPTPSTRTVGGPGGVTDDDAAGGGGVAGIWAEAEDGADSLAAVGLGVDVDRGERGAGERAIAVVVEADDGLVGRGGQAKLARTLGLNTDATNGVARRLW